MSPYAPGTLCCEAISTFSVGGPAADPWHRKDRAQFLRVDCCPDSAIQL